MEEIWFYPLTAAHLQRMRAIEQQAYKDTPYAQMQRCLTWEDVADYMECELEEIRYHGTEEYYILCAEHESEVEIVDLSSINGRANLKAVVHCIESFDKPITMDCRENTSYVIVKYMERRGKLILQEDEVHEWGGEQFHCITAITMKAIERNPSLQQEEMVER